MVKACAPKSSFVGSRDRALIALISSSGLRASECLGLTESDLHVDSEMPYVVVRHAKGGQIREAACSFEAAQAVLTYVRQRRKHKAAHRSELWLSRAGGALTVSGLRQIVHDAAGRVGLDVTTHHLRHSAVHGMLARGMAEGDVMVQAGWTSAKQLQRYGKSRATERSRAAFFRTSDS
jgi:site-specific recombinase XerD